MGPLSHALRPLALLAVTAMAACNGNSAVIPKDEYEATGTVLDVPSYGPVLCLGPILLSLPPGCGGPPVRNWDWAKVPARETAAGVTWADVTLWGTWDGTAFTVTAVLDDPPSGDRPRRKPLRWRSEAPWAG